MNQVPHIETGALSKSLRRCAELLRAASDSSLGYHEELDAAAAEAVKQADALDTIRSQSQIMMLGKVPFEVGILEFPLTEGAAKVPCVSIVEEGAAEGKNTAWGIGFLNREAAGRIGAAILTIATFAPFPETAPDGKTH